MATVTLVAATACRGTLDTPDFRGGSRMADAPTRVEVQNLNYADITVHASRDGAWQRIGGVTGNSSAILEIPSSMSAAATFLRLRVHAIGSSDATDYVTDRISAAPGTTIVLRVAPVLRMSSWSLR